MSAPSNGSVRKLFGTDGIRGRANRAPMTAEIALRLGRAVAARLRREGQRSRIIIGKDTRLSGYMLESALQAGIVSAGADAVLVGPLPTPGIAFITSSMRADAGVVISASHNPYWDNGIKIFARDGYKLPDDVEAEIEGLMEGDGAGQAAGDEMGKARRIEDASGRYLQYLKSWFPRQRTLDGFKVVLDCSNGAAYQVAPQMFSELGAEVIALNVSPDGRNINEGYDTVAPEAIRAAVLKHGANLGVTFDGDADRAMFVDETGRIIDGDFIMAILAARMIDRGTLPGKTVVATTMSNLGLERALAARGGRLLRTQVGDRYVVEAMREGGFILGGEQSGHLVFLDQSTTGDGILSALRVMAVMIEDGTKLSEMAKVMTRYPQVLLSFDVAKKVPLADLPEVGKAIAAAEAQLGSDGRVNVRYSGTESKARVMIEGKDEAMIKGLADGIAGTLKQAVSR